MYGSRAVERSLDLEVAGDERGQRGTGKFWRLLAPVSESPTWFAVTPNEFSVPPTRLMPSPASLSIEFPEILTPVAPVRLTPSEPSR